MTNSDRILFVPSARKGNGTGHLKRCAFWSSRLPRQNFFIPHGEEIFSAEILDGITSCCGHKNIIRKNPGSQWDLVVLDNRCTGADSLPVELRNLPMVVIDESGYWRGQAPYSIDILPAINKKKAKANRGGMSFLNLPQPRKRAGCHQLKGIRNVLVSFGGEDPAGLTQKILSFISTHQTEWCWTFIQGPSFHQDLAAVEVCGKHSILKSPENLKNIMHHYDLVLTSFGLTAFEALSSGADIVLINPTDYHDRLSGNAGLPLIRKGWKKPADIIIDEISTVLHKESFYEQNRALQLKWKPSGESFSDWISKITPGNTVCPVCGCTDNQLLYRYENKTYFQCRSRSCGMVYMINFMEKQDLYSTAYFFEDYQKQYGKTYLQDFKHIKESGFSRLKSIEKLQSYHNTLLDIGCAFGPFLSAASDRGFKCYGLDVSEAAVEYINKNLAGIEAVSTSFEAFSPESTFGVNEFDIITLWYVIEHFRDPYNVLKRIFSLLKAGGILALSTPNGRGVSGALDQENFLKISPDDHYTVWDKKSARRLLKKAGFSRIRFVTTGYHPERIPVKLPLRKILDKTILLWTCKLFRMGDTFEIYAVKKGKP